MLKHCHATAIEHRRGNSQRSLKSPNLSDKLHDNSSLNLSSSSSNLGSVINFSFVGNETSVDTESYVGSETSGTFLASPVLTTNSPNSSIVSSPGKLETVKHVRVNTKRSSYSSPEGLSMVSRACSYASLSIPEANIPQTPPQTNGKNFSIHNSTRILV